MTNNTRTCGCDWLCGCPQRQAKDKWETSLSVQKQLRGILVDCGLAHTHTQTLPARTKGGEAEAEAEFNALFGNIFQKGRLMKNKGTN